MKVIINVVFLVRSADACSGYKVISHLTSTLMLSDKVVHHLMFSSLEVLDWFLH